jgi:hypothetical protein
MAKQDNEPESAYQGPAARTGDTEDGLYPDAQGDMGHKKGGDTESLPGSNEPLASESGLDKSTTKGNAGDPASTLDSTVDEQ